MAIKASDFLSPAKSRHERGEAARTLTMAGVNHALHDGYTDVIYVLLPVWQTEFALSYGLLALLRGLYSGTMAGLQIPVGRIGHPRDISATCGFLCSEEAGFITGQNILLDGGAFPGTL